jgi:putative peptidoglycan lipid II flippase
MKRFFSQSKNLFSAPQDSVFTAAGVIMVMIVISKLLGLLRNITLLELFTAEEVSLFFSAFRLPDTIFEVLVFGTFSSAFIPVFAKLIKKDQKEAWNVASIIMNYGVLIFGVFAIVVGIFADNLYSVIAPGYSIADRAIIVSQTRVLLVAQVLFVASYVLTGVLESLRRFLVPALAPIFYNVGIVGATYFFGDTYGLMAAAYGALIGALAHLLIQLPLAIKLGFRFKFKLSITDDVKKILHLAAPRLAETGVIQISKMAELFLASLVSTASYAYFYLGNTLQSLPVGLFGVSIAKAALPTLADQSDSPVEFKKTVLKVLYQMVFVVVPFAVMLLVLRIPVVRLVYGRELFDWNSTYETSLVLSAFATGIVFQVVISLLSRAFYALHDTKTPVIIAVCVIFTIVGADFLLLRVFHTGVWGLAAAYSFCIGIQSVLLYVLLFKKLGKLVLTDVIPIIKSLMAGAVSGAVMFFLLKIFDRSVWIKQISFFGAFDIAKNIPFESFVLDTRYTINLFVLTVFVSCVGLATYVLIAYLLGSKEVMTSLGYVTQMFNLKKDANVPKKETETITPPSSDTTVS